MPSYDALGETETRLGDATVPEVAPYGTWWADWASTSNEWIRGGSETGGAGAAYDYAVLHVRPQSGAKSLEETVGAALDADFSAPSASEVASMGAWGYPAAPPYGGLKMFRCVDRPGRLALSPSLPSVYRTPPDEPPVIVHPSPSDNTCLAGPQLGREAETLDRSMSRTYGGR